MRKVVCRCIIKDASESRDATAVAAAADFPEPFNVAEIFVGDLLRTKERTNRRRGTQPKFDQAERNFKETGPAGEPSERQVSRPNEEGGLEIIAGRIRYLDPYKVISAQ